MNRRILKLLHLWLSVPLGVIIVLMCLSGAILLFERDFGHIGQAEVNCEGAQPLPIDSILYSATKYLNGENFIVSLVIYPDSHHAYKIMLATPLWRQYGLINTPVKSLEDMKEQRSLKLPVPHTDAYSANLKPKEVWEQKSGN